MVAIKMALQPSDHLDGFDDVSRKYLCDGLLVGYTINFNSSKSSMNAYRPNIFIAYLVDIARYQIVFLCLEVSFWFLLNFKEFVITF